MTEPYYQDDLVTLYHGDCLATLGWLTADVLITDPPYGMSYTGFGGRKGEPRRDRAAHAIDGDESTFARDAALALWGATKPALVFGRWNLPRPAGTRQRLIWDKTPCGFMGDLSLPWGSVEEEVYVIGGPFTGKREGNIVHAQTLMSADARRPDHPTPKPVGLMEVLIRKTTGVVADPFAGSGSTLIAARTIGRPAIGVEVEERYCELIAQRLAHRTLDLGEDWS